MGNQELVQQFDDFFAHFFLSLTLASQIQPGHFFRGEYQFTCFHIRLELIAVGSAHESENVERLVHDHSRLETHCFSCGRKAAYTSVLNNVAALSTRTRLECLGFVIK